ncbi:hypothetical protein VCHA57P511_300033 [Vibrio chagasii]|nr:hypothetical protein VCHA57P511_300033 [Vibrio chagasii]
MIIMVKTKAIKAPMVQTPAPAAGSPSIPAPTQIHATIHAPPISEGVFTVIDGFTLSITCFVLSINGYLSLVRHCFLYDHYPLRYVGQNFKIKKKALESRTLALSFENKIVITY